MKKILNYDTKNVFKRINVKLAFTCVTSIEFCSDNLHHIKIFGQDRELN